MTKNDQAGQSSDRDIVDRCICLRHVMRDRLGYRHGHLFTMCFLSMLVVFAVSPSCQLGGGSPLPLLLPLIISSAISVVLAVIVLKCTRRNSLIRERVMIVITTVFPVLLTIYLAASPSLPPCERLGVLGILGTKTAPMIALLLALLVSFGRTRARDEAGVGSGLAALFASCVVAAGGAVTHGGRWREMVSPLCCLALHSWSPL